MTPRRPKNTRSRPRLYLGYSTNVHRSENLKQIYRFLGRFTIPVKRRVFGEQPGGLELRLGIGAARDLLARPRRDEFRSHLEEAGLEIFSINAFPLHDFQARRVKQDVYAPSWDHKERVRWTNQICDILASLLPEGRPGSVSTLGGTYRFWKHTPATFAKIARNYLEVLGHLEDLQDETGRDIVLAAEPEPDTTFEIASDVISFVEDHLIPTACQDRTWKRRHGSRQKIEEVVRRRFTVNLDTCHFSVLFHSPAEALGAFKRAGVAVGKLHITNAPALRSPHRSPSGYRTLRGMNEPRYLHQFCGRDSNGEQIWRGRDLDELPRQLSRDKHPNLDELRTHFHVPLYLKRYKNLRTTREETAEAVKRTVREKLCRHLVIETYTWPVLAREDQLIRGITAEFRWLLKTLNEIR